MADDNKGDSLRISTSGNTVHQPTDKDNLVFITGDDPKNPIQNNVVYQGAGDDTAIVGDAKKTYLDQGDGKNEFYAAGTSGGSIQQGKGNDWATLMSTRQLSLNQGAGDDKVHLQIREERQDGKKTAVSFNEGASLDGGEGKDTIILDGKRADYDIVISRVGQVDEARITHKDQPPSERGDTGIRRYETIEFADEKGREIDVSAAVGALKEMGVTQADETAISTFMSAKSVNKSPQK